MTPSQLKYELAKDEAKRRGVDPTLKPRALYKALCEKGYFWFPGARRWQKVVQQPKKEKHAT